MYIYNKVLFSLAAMLTLALGTKAQDKIVFPDISYAGTPRTCVIAGLNVDGIEGYENTQLAGISGLVIGGGTTVARKKITHAVRGDWEKGLFSEVSIGADPLFVHKIFFLIIFKGR